VKRLLRLALAAAAAWLASGCSTLQITYENADLLLRWRLTSYLELQGAEAEQLEGGIASFLAWHRADALPQYARVADEAGERVARGISRDDLVWGYDIFLAQARESLRAAADRIAPLLDRLTPEQVARVERRFAEDNREFAQEFLAGTPGERRKRRLQRTVERLEGWVGSLSEAQAERVRRYSERAPLVDELRDRYRRRRQAGFVSMLRAREVQRRLTDWAARWDSDREPAYAAASRAHLEEYFSMLLELDRMLSAEQRAKAVARFRSFAEDFTSLAGRRRAESASR